MSELPIVNVELMKRVLAHIKADPENWHQGQWIDSRATNECKTAGCFAGWAAQLSGYQPVFKEGLVWNEETLQYDFGIKQYTEYVTDAQGKEYEVASLAQQLLGLNALEAGELFGAANSLTRLTKLTEDYAAGHSREPGYFDDLEDEFDDDSDFFGGDGDYDY